MAKTQILLLLVAFCLASCQATVDRMADDIADQVSDQVAEQVNSAVAVQVGTAVAGLSNAAVSPPPSSSEAGTSFTCENKRCTEMISCEEALYKLNSCDQSSLDRDKDGIPCESICSAADVDAADVAAAPAVSAAEPAGDASAEGEVGQVTRVIDGDTIDVLIDGKNVRIRYLQMNTPERDQPCFRESTDRNAELVAGQTVRLVPDTELVDPYDRLLRYVYVGEISVSRVLVEEGYAEVVLYPPNDAHYEEFVALEQAAAQAGLGCHPTGIFDDGSTRR